jgi:hypothetical protein
MILYLKDSQSSTKTPRYHNPFSKWQNTKINRKKSAAFLYIDNEQTEKAIRKTIPFTIISNNKKFRNIFNK